MVLKMQKFIFQVRDVYTTIMLYLISFFFFFNEIIQNDYVFVNHFVKRTCMRLIEIVNTAF